MYDYKYETKEAKDTDKNLSRKRKRMGIVKIEPIHDKVLCSKAFVCMVHGQNLIIFVDVSATK